MRQIVLDTETTGLEPELGHRIIEIGGVELIDRKLTGRHFHQYINPERDIDAEALAVHGISLEFLADKPLFGDIYQDFIDFISGAELIIHNAPFDLKFLNHELRLIQMDYPLLEMQNSIYDTLVQARKDYPGQRNSLDALCKRFSIDNSNRELHGALLDAELLAKVYLAMTGGQVNLFAEFSAPERGVEHVQSSQFIAQRERKLVIRQANAEELSAHEAFLAILGNKN